MVRVILGRNNQRQIVCGVNLFAMDNDSCYPESVATIGDELYWNWQEPMMITGYRARSPRLHRRNECLPAALYRSCRHYVLS